MSCVLHKEICKRKQCGTEDVCVTETDDRKSFFVSEMPGFVNYWFDADKMELYSMDKGMVNTF